MANGTKTRELEMESLHGQMAPVTQVPSQMTTCKEEGHSNGQAAQPSLVNGSRTRRLGRAKWSAKKMERLSVSTMARGKTI